MKSRFIGLAVGAALALSACSPAQPQGSTSSNTSSGGALRSLAEGFVPDSRPVRLVVEIADFTRLPDGVTPGDLNQDPRFSARVTPFRLYDPGWDITDAHGIVGQAIGHVDTNLLIRGPFAADDLPAPAERFGDGRWTFGTGKDDMVETPIPEKRLSAIGTPVRIGQSDDELFFTRATKDLEDWEKDANTLGDNETVMRVIDELDGKDSFSAVITPAGDPMGAVRESAITSREQAMRDLDERLLIRETCDYLGLGYSEADGDVLTHAVYAFPTDESAEKALPMVEEAWTNGTDKDGAPVSNLIEKVVGVERSGRLVVATLDAGDQGRALTRSFDQPPLACFGASAG